MSGWEMAPHTVNGEKTFRVGASFVAPADEHYYGLGQNQEGTLDYRGRTIDCKHNYDAPAGETVCVPFMVTNKGYGIVWDNPSDTTVSAGLHGHTTWQSDVGERVSFFVIAGATTDEIYAGYRQADRRHPAAAQGRLRATSRARPATRRSSRCWTSPRAIAHAAIRSMSWCVDWFYWTRMGQLDIDPIAFPDPTAMNQTAARAGHTQHHQRLAAVRKRVALLRLPGRQGLAAEGQERQAGRRPRRCAATAPVP